MADQNQTEADNKELVRNLMEEVFNEKNVDAADEFLAIDYTEYATGNGESFQSREEFKAGNADFFTAFPDLTVTEDGCIAEGNTVVYRHTLTGTHKGEIMGVEPTGNEITLENAGVFRIKNGKIIDLYLYADNISLMRQLGIITES
ncbi:ester cyclase [Haladaptatus salinisoli]|uniref:ester cyclase n=1 Tax=Haladaptatus salinisoli TaxID=2884876 RepID=UPI001D0A4664|nr:ester cyclase [Haladaptatus salinisoli]